MDKQSKYKDEILRSPGWEHPVPSVLHPEHLLGEEDGEDGEEDAGDQVHKYNTEPR